MGYSAEVTSVDIGGPAPEGPHRERTFAFIDLAGFTALTEVHGDHEAADLAQRFESLARSCLGEDDLLVKSIGDAVLVTSPTPAGGLELVRRVVEACYDEPGFPVPRAGLHHGSAVERAGDFYGATVNLTARVASQAAGTQTLATAIVAEDARRLGIGTVDLGSFELRNVGTPVELFEIELCPQPEGGSTDPVCRMWTARATATGRLRHGGRDYLFCSLACAAQFAVAPERYAGG